MDSTASRVESRLRRSPMKYDSLDSYEASQRELRWLRKRSGVIHCAKIPVFLYALYGIALSTVFLEPCPQLLGKTCKRSGHRLEAY